MSNSVAKMQCVICEIELKNPIMLGETAPKGWAKKHGYDGYQWNEPKERVLACLTNVKQELLDGDDDYVIFFTCMKHTDKNFDTVGEAEEVNQDEED